MSAFDYILIGLGVVVLFVIVAYNRLVALRQIQSQVVGLDLTVIQKEQGQAVSQRGGKDRSNRTYKKNEDALLHPRQLPASWLNTKIRISRWRLRALSFP